MNELDSANEAAQCREILERIRGTHEELEALGLTVRWILAEFDMFYSEFKQISPQAQQAFEAREPQTSLALSRHRLSLYSVCVHRMGLELVEAFPAIATNENFWREVERRYRPLIEGRYEWDLALAFIHSVRRKVYLEEWQPVDYSQTALDHQTQTQTEEVYHTFPVGGRIAAESVRDILQLPGFRVPYRDIEDDARLVAERVNQVLGLDAADTGSIEAIQMVDGGFFRNRGAYLVGRIVSRNAGLTPFVIALLNSPEGIYVDAVLTTETDTHNCFSSTLANFHVTHDAYHELSRFLHSIMPGRTVGLHYTTIGYNHLGKVAVMNELEQEIQRSGEVLQTAVGSPGTVAIGFSSPSSAYNLKVIRDHPTEGYKWGEFGGIESVKEKYAQVHDINRTGSMLDNIIYHFVRLDRDWFEPALLAELLEQASESVSLQGDSIVFKFLIVQLRLTPLPVYLETASDRHKEIAVVNLGYCIRNNTAANIFNKDLDARNYGVSRYRKVYLFDYDALEPLGDVKIRSNQDRFDGEEDIPDWYFEEGVVFLPEEMEAGLCIPNRHLRRLFRAAHGDLMTTAYWERIQREIQDGKVPPVSVYPDERRLPRTAPV